MFSILLIFLLIRVKIKGIFVIIVTLIRLNKFDMKKGLLILSVILISLFAKAQTDGELNVSVRTSTYGGQYGPRNCVAIWVEDDQGNFVKTLLAYAQLYKTHLNNWQASTTAAGSPFNTTDAISGASMTNHGTRTCTWDGTDYQGTLMSDGSYRVCMEMTESNATGKYSYFSFTKSSSEDNQTPSDAPSFSDIVLGWTPSQNDVADVNISKISILPNPTTGFITINSDEMKSVEIWSLTGKQIIKTNSRVIDISSQPNGLYFVKVATEDALYTRRILKQ